MSAKFLLAATPFLVAQVCCFAQQEATAPTGAAKYQAAESAAPQQQRIDLSRLRERGQQEGWKFKVGYTSAFAKPLSMISGTTIPENFLAFAIAQNEFAEKANGAADESARLAGITQPEFLGNCSPDKSEFNWRDEKMLSRVSSQGQCGSCWGFTAAAVFEGAYKIRNNVDIEVSEQHILDCATGNDGASAGSCKGGWYDPAFQWMIRNGVTNGKAMPYVERKQACLLETRGEYRAVSWVS